ncbi:hypothetical protein BN11_1520019 [Nostocoides australiense Ben110]|uniref:HPr kinase n=1 Tax=Nostocoides australiense Ben110 TaxID=1193182 RepID=W6JUR4_9MICO|nr:hypothetical protein [Tetrasphaera australiensis]CCH72306.1 hypothetical protein BN11_1520019 [Tetrasphaera australiensis Ben110]
MNSGSSRGQNADLLAGPYAANGQRFVVECPDARLRRLVASAFVDLLTDAQPLRPTRFRVAPSPEHPGRYEVWRDDELCEIVTSGHLMTHLVWQVTALVLQNCAPRTPVHAAVVAINGRAVLVAGESYAGKSTLAGWLTARGWEFLTDELALLEEVPGGWHVHPFPRPIGLRHPSPLDALLGGSPQHDSESLVPASRLGQVGNAARLSAVVLPGREPGLPRRLSAAHPATALRLLMSHLPHGGIGGRAAFRQVARLTSSVPVFHLGVGDLDVADAQLRALAGPPGAPGGAR